MSTQYGFFIDSARCTGCKTCELACKDYKNLTPEVSFRRIYEYAGGDWQEDNGVWQQNVFACTSPSPVTTAKDPACTRSVRAARCKREDGFVVVNGMHWLPLLPYGLPVRRPTVQRRQRPYMTKCDGCHERVAEEKSDLRRESPPARCGRRWIRADCRTAR